MEKMSRDGMQLIGIALPHKTFNANGQSAIDCGNHWVAFEKGDIFNRIPGKLNNHVYAVYYDYDGDHTQPYRYFIGCAVQPGTEAPEGLDLLEIPGGEFVKLTAKGIMPDCVAAAWKEIWQSDLERDYRFDFEQYDERSTDWQKVEVDIFLSV